MSRQRLAVRASVIVAVFAALARLAVAAPANGASIAAADLKEWLSFIASDALDGRALYSAGMGQAAAYVEEHLQEWGVQRAGDDGSYLQTVRVLGIKATSHSSVTVEV